MRILVTANNLRGKGVFRKVVDANNGCDALVMVLTELGQTVLRDETFITCVTFTEAEAVLRDAPLPKPAVPTNAPEGLALA